jgi:hypothetical protein
MYVFEYSIMKLTKHCRKKGEWERKELGMGI